MTSQHQHRVGDPPPATDTTADLGSGDIGRTIAGRYTLRAEIGRGGMGTVWQAYDTLLRRDVAVKEVQLPPGIPPEEREALYERTLREARAAAGITHPAVVRVYDVITDSGRPWIVMERLEARSLAEILEADGPLPPRAVAKIGLAVLGALEAAHNVGVLHRDVKPGNVLICSDGRCVLTDFGVARTATDGQLTTPGMVLGSPHYISPERALGGEFGPPSDLFSLGVTLYAAVEGRTPFDRGDALATMQAVVHEPPDAGSRAGNLAPILHGLLDKTPERRWAVDRTRDALRNLLLGALAPPASAVDSQTDPHAVMRTAVHPSVAPPAHTAGSGVGGRAMVPSDAQGAGSTPGRGTLVGFAAVPVPAAAPMSGPPAYLTPEPPYGPAATTGHRPLGPWLFGAVAMVAAIVIVVVAIAGASGWFNSDPASDNKPDAGNSAPPLPVRAYTDDSGFSANVPKTWKPRETATYVDFRHPKDTKTWIRLRMNKTSANARRELEAGENFLKRSKDYRDYQRVSLKDVELGGEKGAELQYTLTDAKTGAQRRGIWRLIVIDGQAYQVYLSAQQTNFADSKPFYDEAVRSFKLTA